MTTASSTMSDLLPTPWRRFGGDPDPWAVDVYEKLKNEIVKHELNEEAELDFFNVLLVGQISAGKSSFYNTIESVFSECVTMRADAGSVKQSLTTKFRTYKVKPNDIEPLRFRFCDTMGLSTESGLTPEDFGTIMDGHVSDDTDLRKIKDLQVDVEAEKEDKMHCVVFIVAAPTIEFMDEGVFEKFAKIREQGTNRNLNPVVILTRIDDVDVELNRDEGDIKQVFHSKTVRDLAVTVSEKFGVAQNMVFPVQNYSSEIEKELGIDILMLRALRQILRCSKTCIDDMIEREAGKEKREKKERERARKKELKDAELGMKNAEALVKRLTLSPDRTSSKKKKAPSSPKHAQVCTAIHSRPREDHDELDMVAGEKFVVVKPDDGNGWVEVKNSSGDTGLVPAGWIKMGGDLGTLAI